MTEVSTVAAASFAATCEELWAVLADTPRMVAIDPLLERYEPETGTIQQGTSNRLTARFGPVRSRLTTFTEVLEPPHRAVFVSVTPSRPVRVRTEDLLEPLEGGCRYRVTITAVSTAPGIGPLAAALVPRVMARSRSRFMQRLRTALAAEAGGGPDVTGPIGP
jgi:hypothetical protein